ncbi:WD repeat-containing protein slp1, partial [Massospora cicadina]
AQTVSTDACSLEQNQNQSSKDVLEKEKIVEATENATEINANLSPSLSSEARILNFATTAPTPRLPVFVVPEPPKPTSPKARRFIPNRPEKVLSAPGYENDFYTNLLAWSSTNYLAIGLLDPELHKSLVYVWDANTGTINSLITSGFKSRVRGLSWSLNGRYLSVGLDNGSCQIWDVETLKVIRTLVYDDPSPIPALAWAPELFATGDANGRIFRHDLREKKHMVGTFESHSLSVCKLQWCLGGDWLTSGGNDNAVKVFDIRMVTPFMKKTVHSSAVKALAWCPWNSSQLATGGGKNDNKIRLWDVKTGTQCASVDTKSPVLSLLWAPIHKELVSTHGNPKNSFTIWECPDLVEIINVPAHDSRVLESAISPDGFTY